MKRAAIYLRVSTVAQATRGREPEGYSIPAQREACQAKAAELDAEVVAEYADKGESAKTADRPKLQALLARLDEQGDLDYVIVHKVDRLARNRYDDATITYALHEAGAELVSVTENIDRTPVGRFMHAIVAANAEFYSANLAAEAKKGLVQKAKTGGTPTRAPIGYLNVRKVIEGRELRTVEIDPERAPHVRWAFAAYGSGAYTLDTLLAALAKRGLRTRPTAKKPEKPLSRSQLAAMLQNPYYVGVVRYAGVEYEGRHDHLIDGATFANAKAVLAAHNHATEKDRKHHHYLKGSLYCGRCGSRMSLIQAKGNGGRYPYFFCIGRMKGTGCNQPYVPVDLIETAVERVYGEVRLTVRQAERLRAKLGQAMAGMRRASEAEVARQRRRLAKLGEEREKLLHAYYAEAVPLDLLHSEQERLSSETAQAERQIEVAESPSGDAEDTLGKALDLLANCERAYRAAPGHLRRQWNQALFERLVVYDEGIADAEVAEPFATLSDPELPARLGR
ncbi:MAG TPA: recombinase family protein, partial [Solirubrobacterales bacterium]|nr:recombinase family protein [Solirubrobacterales bacterium]